MLRQEWTRADAAMSCSTSSTARTGRLTRAAAELVSREAAQPGTHVTVVLPRRSYSPLLGRLLHDRTADKIAAVVSQIQHSVATIVPFDVRSRLEVLHARQVARAQGEAQGEPRPGRPKASRPGRRSPPGARGQPRQPRSRIPGLLFPGAPHGPGPRPGAFRRPGPTAGDGPAPADRPTHRDAGDPAGPTAPRVPGRPERTECLRPATDRAAGPAGRGRRAADRRPAEPPGRRRGPPARRAPAEASGGRRAAAPEEPAAPGVVAGPHGGPPVTAAPPAPTPRDAQAPTLAPARRPADSRAGGDHPATTGPSRRPVSTPSGRSSNRAGPPSRDGYVRWRSARWNATPCLPSRSLTQPAT